MKTSSNLSNNIGRIISFLSRNKASVFAFTMLGLISSQLRNTIKLFTLIQETVKRVYHDIHIAFQTTRSERIVLGIYTEIGIKELRSGSPFVLQKKFSEAENNYNSFLERQQNEKTFKKAMQEILSVEPFYSELKSPQLFKIDNQQKRAYFLLNAGSNFNSENNIDTFVSQTKKYFSDVSDERNVYVTALANDCDEAKFMGLNLDSTKFKVFVAKSFKRIPQADAHAEEIVKLSPETLNTRYRVKHDGNSPFKADHSNTEAVHDYINKKYLSGELDQPTAYKFTCDETKKTHAEIIYLIKEKDFIKAGAIIKDNMSEEHRKEIFDYEKAKQQCGSLAKAELEKRFRRRGVMQGGKAFRLKQEKVLYTRQDTFLGVVPSPEGEITTVKISLDYSIE